MGRSRLNRTTDWWRAQSDTQRYRLYTQVTLQLVVVGVAVAVSVPAPAVWGMIGTWVAGFAAVLALESQPDFAIWSPMRARRWLFGVAVGLMVGVWIVYAVLARVLTGQGDLETARPVGVYTALLAGMAVLPFLRHRWWLLGAIAIVTGIAYAGSPRGVLGITGVVAATGTLLMVTTLLTRWGLQVIDDLERAKAVEARLRVAEERLRFSRDLHDVVGRGFSAIAVKSELAGTLLRARSTDKAEVEIDEIKVLAVQSMEQMRALVRGYRDIDLVGEVAGTRSLLSAAGCDLVVEGDPAQVPDRFHEVAAWVVREGTTNIVKHSSASSAWLTLGPTGMSLRNDGVAEHDSSTSGPRSGLQGLAERLEMVGASLRTSRADGLFTLQIRWEPT
ncbi:sensor histidine kinase [Gordonia terrae]|uniref:Two-component histidine kinase n=1 Tax=Gordonia terrae NBRC 100016 TaxID=1089454 RepID=A0ABQ0HFL2_9ACTN|nr:histidine kinase [Gordonia terrae]ANY21578.1 histidine kinase [Gordonia terrae]GAB44630.1 putative two-component histidine kinase [Gordonia terrae NBRC 100016]VTR08831.1 Sensor histidine kinase desK [Clostridioides difficile]VTS17125.1 Sensor histidine kinase desK [Gordonia terrae]